MIDRVRHSINGKVIGNDRLETEGKIDQAKGKVKEGVDLVNQAGTSLNEIVVSIKQVADIVAEMRAAGEEPQLDAFGHVRIDKIGRAHV